MTFTEECALNKLCPNLIHNLGNDIGDPLYCMASKCMAWRFVRTRYTCESFVCAKQFDEPHKKCPVCGSKLLPPVGYCGLAGKP